ncbi:MAG TPA: molybdopterin-synthase adenylyltransferase MoeB [Bacteroidota bacterium]|nr:molybdopterin-synthase adenylyltransferase MoeB [Bacteroidota bacterium]
MSVNVLIPTPLRPYADAHDRVAVAGKTVGETLSNLVLQYPSLKRHLYGDDGKLRNYINIYVNDEDIRYLEKEKTPVTANDVVSIVPSIAGGSGAATAERVELSREEMLRYSRHLIMPEVGLEGQKKLKAARVLLIGAGGLGSPLGLYLAAAGVGTIGIVDFDKVDLTNLHRQLLHGTTDVGRSKLDSARDRLADVNPHVNVETYEMRLTSENALDLLERFDVIIDGTDNFPTRYLVNDACVLLGKPNVYGSIFRFDGQVTVFDARKGPCYRCLYAAPPPPGLVPSCAEGGVLGVLPGIIGTLQALEAIKIIIGHGEVLVGRLVLFDAFTMKFREFKLRKDPQCPICSANPTIHQLIDYEQFCGTSPHPTNGTSEFEISVQELKSRLDRGDDLLILDVREAHEYEINNLNGLLIPLNQLPARVHELDSSREIIVHCKMGGRSARAVEFLRQSGFRKVKNLVGGIDAWAENIDPTMPHY